MPESKTGTLSPYNSVTICYSQFSLGYTRMDKLLINK